MSSPHPSRRSRWPGCRAQSETIGTILLVGVVVTAVGLFGAFYLGGFAEEAGPLVSISVDGNETTMNLTHTGGESVPADELFVTVGQAGTNERYELDESAPRSEFVRGDNPAQFVPGDRWRFETDRPGPDGLDLSPGESATVRLIHVPTNEVVATERYTVPSD